MDIPVVSLFVYYDIKTFINLADEISMSPPYITVCNKSLIQNIILIFVSDTFRLRKHSLTHL